MNIEYRFMYKMHLVPDTMNIHVYITLIIFNNLIF